MGLNFSCIAYNSPNGTLELNILDDGFDNVGIGSVHSQLVQFNVNTPATAGAIFVDKNNQGTVKISAPNGYRIVDGHGEIDPENIWSDNYDAQPPRPHRTAIKGAVRISFTRTDDSGGTIVVEPLTHLLMGTINVRFFIKYTKIV